LNWRPGIPSHRYISSAGDKKITTTPKHTHPKPITVVTPASQIEAMLSNPTEKINVFCKLLNFLYNSSGNEEVFLQKF